MIPQRNYVNIHTFDWAIGRCEGKCHFGLLRLETDRIHPYATHLRPNLIRVADLDGPRQLPQPPPQRLECLVALGLHTGGGALEERGAAGLDNLEGLGAVVYRDAV